MTMTLVFGGFSNMFFITFTVPGFYLGLMVIQLVCIFFVHTWLIETKGKTKEECEKLYMVKTV